MSPTVDPVATPERLPAAPPVVPRRRRSGSRPGVDSGRRPGPARRADGDPPASGPNRPSGPCSSASATWSTASSIVSVRYRWIVAEDEPEIAGYDQDLWVSRLRHGQDDPAALVAVFEALRGANLELWSRLPVEDRARIGRHRERGAESYDLTFQLERRPRPLPPRPGPPRDRRCPPAGLTCGRPGRLPQCPSGPAPAPGSQPGRNGGEGVRDPDRCQRLDLPVLPARRRRPAPRVDRARRDPRRRDRRDRDRPRHGRQRDRPADPRVRRPVRRRRPVRPAGPEHERHRRGDRGDRGRHDRGRLGRAALPRLPTVRGRTGVPARGRRRLDRPDQGRRWTDERRGGRGRRDGRSAQLHRRPRRRTAGPVRSFG